MTEEQHDNWGPQGNRLSADPKYISKNVSSQANRRWALFTSWQHSATREHVPSCCTPNHDSVLPMLPERSGGATEGRRWVPLRSSSLGGTYSRSGIAPPLRNKLTFGLGGQKQMGPVYKRMLGLLPVCTTVAFSMQHSNKAHYSFKLSPSWLPGVLALLTLLAALLLSPGASSSPSSAQSIWRRHQRLDTGSCTVSQACCFPERALSQSSSAEALQQALA